MSWRTVFAVPLPHAARANGDLSAVLGALTRRAYDLLAIGRGADRGTMIAAARRIRVDANTAVTYAVLAERASGASWREVATALCEDEEFVREHYGPIEQRWLAGGGVGPLLAGRRGQPQHG